MFDVRFENEIEYVVAFPLMSHGDDGGHSIANKLLAFEGNCQRYLFSFVLCNRFCCCYAVLLVHDYSAAPTRNRFREIPLSQMVSLSRFWHKCQLYEPSSIFAEAEEWRRTEGSGVRGTVPTDTDIFHLILPCSIMATSQINTAKHHRHQPPPKANSPFNMANENQCILFFTFSNSERSVHFYFPCYLSSFDTIWSWVNSNGSMQKPSKGLEPYDLSLAFFSFHLLLAEKSHIERQWKRSQIQILENQRPKQTNHQSSGE